MSFICFLHEEEELTKEWWDRAYAYTIKRRDRPPNPAIMSWRLDWLRYEIMGYAPDADEGTNQGEQE